MLHTYNLLPCLDLCLVPPIHRSPHVLRLSPVQPWPKCLLNFPWRFVGLQRTVSKKPASCGNGQPGLRISAALAGRAAAISHSHWPSSQGAVETCPTQYLQEHGVLSTQSHLRDRVLPSVSRYAWSPGEPDASPKKANHSKGLEVIQVLHSWLSACFPAWKRQNQFS